jgi:hypothetical protein
VATPPIAAVRVLLPGDGAALAADSAVVEAGADVEALSMVCIVRGRRRQSSGHRGPTSALPHAGMLAEHAVTAGGYDPRMAPTFTERI